MSAARAGGQSRHARPTMKDVAALAGVAIKTVIAVVAPLYLLLRDLGWLNSYQGLILVYTAFNLPFAIWILRNYMLGIPKEMEETGRIDGAGPIRTLWTIILPMALPGLFTAGIFSFTACWTEFLFALTFNSATRTIPVGIAEFGTVYTSRTGPSSPPAWWRWSRSASWYSSSASS